MNKVWPLAIAFLREHPARVGLTLLATAAATCMVIWVTASYDALLKSFDTWANVALGHYELSIAPISHDQPEFVPADVLNAMRSDPAVAKAEPFWAIQTVVTGRARPADVSKEESRPPQSSGPPNLRSEYTVLASTIETPPFPVTGRWLTATDPLSHEVVVRAETAKRLKVELNDTLKITHNKEVSEFRIVGLIQTPVPDIGVPLMLTPSSGDVFMTTALAEQIFHEPSNLTFIGIAMQPGADITKFRFGWSPKLSRFETPVQFQEAHEIEERLDESSTADNVRIQSYAATGIALLVALLVIFCTINMGVTERVRQFAILRAVVLTKTQLNLLIFAEGFLLAAIGFAGGVFVSWLMLSSVARAFAQLLHHGAVIGSVSLTLASAATFGGALLASVVPAWRATRVRPIDAMAPRTVSADLFTLPWKTILFGGLLIAVNPLLTFVFPPKHDSHVVATLVVGFICMSMGFVLISPAVVALVDRWFSPVLAKLFSFDPQLIASQITSNIWRTVAAAISLAVGLSLYVGVQVWGLTMLDAFIVGPWAPDAILAFDSRGLPLDDLTRFQQIDGIKSQQCLPIVVEQPRLLNDITGSAERASITRQDNVVIVGIDPQQAFGGDHPLFVVDWAAGDRQSAILQMSTGRACLVPDHFLEESHLKVGDSFELIPPDHPDHPVKYTIAGAVKIPGWHWQTKLTGFRSRTHRTAAMVFANYPDVAKDFDHPTATHLWLNYSRKNVQPDEIAKAANRLHATENPADAAVSGGDSEPGVRIISVEQVRQMTRRNAVRWIWAISQLPLIAVIISGIGVLNVILASIRSRQWELGVLRSIGISQSSIVRAILAEGLLIGCVACVISLAFGILAGWCGCGIAQYISFFGGLHPALYIPWLAIAPGLVLVLIVTACAGLWPAITIGRKQPLALLQEGQSTF